MSEPEHPRRRHCQVSGTTRTQHRCRHEFVVVKTGTLLDDDGVVGLKVITQPSPLVVVGGIASADETVKLWLGLETTVSTSESVVVRTASRVDDNVDDELVELKVNKDPSPFVIVVRVKRAGERVKPSPDAEMTVNPSWFVVIQTAPLVDEIDEALVGMKVIADPSPLEMVVGVESAGGIVKPFPELDMTVSRAELVVVITPGVFDEFDG